MRPSQLIALVLTLASVHANVAPVNPNYGAPSVATTASKPPADLVPTYSAPAPKTSGPANNKPKPSGDDDCEEETEDCEEEDTEDCEEVEEECDDETSTTAAKPPAKNTPTPPANQTPATLAYIPPTPPAAKVTPPAAATPATPPANVVATAVYAPKLAATGLYSSASKYTAMVACSMGAALLAL
ncbi:hypothetical protein HDU80_003474 [Chytriomyces hyalinus]|nr:hypothetical protein HDU80_003474 [Chytriomyces hyalinus]